MRKDSRSSGDILVYRLSGSGNSGGNIKGATSSKITLIPFENNVINIKSGIFCKRKMMAENTFSIHVRFFNGISFG